jgi:Glyoxalase-like domain
MPHSTIDHVVITAPSLDAGKEMVFEALGVWPRAGGEHSRMGTHNLLLRLGPKVYLEVISIDPKQPSPDRPRWFELDRKAGTHSPTLATWVARCDDIHTANVACESRFGAIEPMNRGDFRWAITIPKDGSLPFNGIAPTLIQWQIPDHPASRLEDLGCTLIQLQGFHPEAKRINDSLAKIGFAGQVTISTHTSAFLLAQIQTPRGLRELRGAA